MTSLFDANADRIASEHAPLADRMRPRSLGEVVGQQSLLGAGGPLTAQLAAGHVPNMILVGPPGSGKTTIARLVAAEVGWHLTELSAVSVGVPQVRAMIAEARERLGAHEQPSLLFLDEIHRFNRAQQDALLPAVEDGTIRLVGATTETPYATINQALLSRVVTYELAPLTPDDMEALIRRAVADEARGLSRAGTIQVDEAAVARIIERSGSDARAALTLLEAAAAQTTPGSRQVTAELVERASDARAIRHDRAGDQHYDLVSAYIKSMRGGDIEGATTWLAAMIEGGEDPMFIARRLAIFASEDVGPADPQALLLATAALQVTEKVGLPECRITLSQVTRYCAAAPKDRSDYDAIGAAQQAIREHGTPPVPLQLTNRSL